MGSPGSPAYSMALCIHYETNFKKSLFDWQKLFGMTRYFDDLRALVVYNRNCPKSLKFAQRIINLMSAQCYHHSMVLIPEQCDNNQFKFLEAQITVTNKALSSFLVSKNYTSLITSGKFEVVNAQTFYSFTSETLDQRKYSKFGSVCGRLAAAAQYSSSFGDDAIFLPTNIYSTQGSALPKRVH